MADVQAWCASRRLQLNAVKTEVVWLGTLGRLQQLTHLSLTIGSETIQPSTVVRDLGVLIDSELTLQKETRQPTSQYSCFYQLRRIRQVLAKQSSNSSFTPLSSVDSTIVTLFRLACRTT